MIHLTYRICGILLSLLSLTVLTGWLTETPLLTRVFTGFPAMQPNTAACLLLAGVSLLVWNKKPLLIRSAAVAMLVIGGFVIANYFFGVYATALEGLAEVNRMAPNTAFCVILASIAFLLACRRSAGSYDEMVLYFFGAAIMAMGVGSIIGYLLQIESIYGWGTKPRMAMNTAFSFILLGTGIIARARTDGDQGRTSLDLILITASSVMITLLIVCGQTFFQTKSLLMDPKSRDILLTAILISGLALFTLLMVALYLLQQMLRRSENLKDSETRLRAIMESTAEGMITIDGKGIVQSFNKACEHIFGYAPGEVIGRNIKMLMPEPDRSRHDGYIANYHRTGKGKIIGTVGREVEGLRKDGTVFPLELSISAISIEGRPTFSGIVRDITERKQSEMRLARAVEELTESNTQLERFAYICSHDLQEPLRMISNYTQRLEKHLQDHMDDKARHYMQYVTNGAAQARQLISDVLAYAKLGTEARLPEAVDCETVMKSILLNLSGVIEESGAVITHSALPEVNGYPTQVLQLFQNLIANGIKFRGSAPPRIHVEAGRKGREWEFSVRDNGIGIDPEYHERIFLIFQRLHRRGEYPGTGIGLAICKKIVDQHGGTIRVESTPGRGTLFVFTLPAIPVTQKAPYDQQLETA